MLSRVADSLYWMSRYMERADGILRMLKINYASSQDDPHDFSWSPVLQIFTYLEDEQYEVIGTDSRTVLQYMVTDKENPNSVFNIVTKARENARSVQDHITKELWQCLNDFYHTVRDENLVHWLDRDDPVSVLDILIKQGLLYYGTIDITMSRGLGYAFINLGKFIERATQSADILDVKFSDENYDISTADTTYWKYLLMSISGYELYLKTYRSGFEAPNVVELIVLNRDFPRSVLYSINQVMRYFSRLKSDRNAESYQKIEFLIGKLKSKINYSTTDSIFRQDLHKYLEEVKTDLNEIGATLNQHYFAYA
ncbi:MAG TPA: alpha-E domain-containing protein [Chitinophagaceae bacterium]|nr:alpha-E domain-containing protein [Chitinophagaceae bacterium]